MGVKGLASFIQKSFPNAGTTYVLEATEKEHGLIVDGNAFLHFVAKQLDWSKGPCYPQFAIRIVETMHSLAIMKPLYIFDGALPKYKVAERMARNLGKLQTIQSMLSTLGQKTKHTRSSTVLPCLAIQLGIQVCRLQGVPFKVVLEEADDALVYYANLYKAHVLSQDSDFFLYDLPGYIPLDSLSNLPFESNSP